MAMLLASVRGAGNPDANMLCYLLHSFLCRHAKLCAATVSQDLHEGTIHKDAEYHMLPSQHTGYQVLAGMAAMFRLCMHVHNGQLPRMGGAKRTFMCIWHTFLGPALSTGLWSPGRQIPAS